MPALDENILAHKIINHLRFAIYILALLDGDPGDARHGFHAKLLHCLPALLL